MLGLYFPDILADKSVFWVDGWNECHSEDLVGEEIPAGKAHRSGQSGAVMGFSLELEDCARRKPEIWGRPWARGGCVGTRGLFEKLPRVREGSLRHRGAGLSVATPWSPWHPHVTQSCFTTLLVQSRAMKSSQKRSKQGRNKPTDECH